MRLTGVVNGNSLVETLDWLNLIACEGILFVKDPRG